MIELSDFGGASPLSGQVSVPNRRVPVSIGMPMMLRGHVHFLVMPDHGSLRRWCCGLKIGSRCLGANARVLGRRSQGRFARSRVKFRRQSAQRKSSDFARRSSWFSRGARPRSPAPADENALRRPPFPRRATGGWCSKTHDRLQHESRKQDQARIAVGFEHGEAIVGIGDIEPDDLPGKMCSEGE